VSVALQAFIAGSLLIPAALADPAIARPTSASTFNRDGGDPTLERDARGISLMIPERSRSPSGFLYDAPYDIPQPVALSENWNYRFAAELGAVHGSHDGPRFRSYGDHRNGLLLNYLGLGLEHRTDGRYVDLTAGAIGRDDRHYRASFGRYGAFRAILHFSELPKSFTDRARTLFDGAGSGSLTLPAGLVPGGNTPAQVAAALASARPFELGFTRRSTGLEFEATPGERWRFHARYAQERKKGARPFGGASSYPGAPAVETIEPIDYRTHNVSAGAQWVGERAQANLSYAGSFFRNGIGTLTWEHPLVIDPGEAAALREGRMDLYPDNAAHSLKLDWSAALPLQGRASGGLSLARMTQDDALIAPTVNSGLLGGGAVDLANWNTTDALSRRSAGARIDTKLAHLEGSFSPAQDLSLLARLRHYEEDNRAQYNAFNPLTGQYGYLALDGSLNNIVPGFLRVPVRSIPFEYRKDNYGAEADYRLLRRTNVTLGYEREDIRGRYREYGATQEGRWRAALNNRDLPWATVRLSVERATRSGDRYSFDPNRLFYSATALVNAPPTLAQLRKHDIADRRQSVVNGRVNFLLAPEMDLAVSARHLDNDYDAAYGRLAERIQAFNLEWNWQPAPRTAAWAWYGFERVRNDMALIGEGAGILTGDPNAGGAAYPLTNRWQEASRDDAHLLGLGFRHALGRAVLESGYTYHYAPYRTRYGFASAGTLVGGSLAAAGAGDGMPTMTFRQHAFDAGLKISLARDTALKLQYRFERTRFRDWHYDDLPLVFGGGAGVFLGAGPRDYTTHTLGIFIQYAPGRREPGAR
jgi:MtrB/PioB family decaheme-associated outer membrane protein